jgi:UDP-N-acetylglucosamine diphosphorylase/glucosamine-1-phosphate N-acetyltransferase
MALSLHVQKYFKVRVMKQAVILAAGEGQRLRPFTVNKPKAMISIADKPILGYVVEALAQCGIRDMVIVVGYRNNQVLDYMGSGEKFGIEITYVTQQQQLGAAHALYQAKNVVAEEFLVLAGDKLIEADTIRNFVTLEPDAVLVKRQDNPKRYSLVAIEDGVAKDIMVTPEEGGGGLVNTGIYAFNRDIFDLIESDYTIPDAMNRMLTIGKCIKAHETYGVWLDVVYPWDILSLNGTIIPRVTPALKGTIEAGVYLQGQVSVGEDTIIRSNTYITGPVSIGRGCEIGPGACIFPATSIGDNVVVSPFSELRNCVIGNDVHIGSGCILQDSVIDRGCAIGARFTACAGETELKIDSEHHTVKVGAMLGEGCVLGDSITAEPGVIAGNYCQVKSSRLIGGRLPDRSLVV